MRRLLTVAFLLGSLTAVPLGAQTSIQNDDSCDIGLYPAATLLLPYFEVDLGVPRSEARDTILSITNASPLPQIARTVIWTDRGFRLVTLNFYLTGHDQDTVSLFDLLVSGVGPATTSGSPLGPRSVAGNPNHLPAAAAACASSANSISSPLREQIQTALSTGTFGALTGVGNNHPGMMIGYMTFDVVNTCSSLGPTDASYYSSEILFDNVLIGDYVFVNPNAATGNFQGSSPMVHIRAVPEGCTTAECAAGNDRTGLLVNLPYTFYDRFTPGAFGAVTRKSDRRQPLPGVFGARFVDSGFPGGFSGEMILWREGVTTASATSFTANAVVPAIEIVRFDESENPVVSTGAPSSPLAFRAAVSGFFFPLDFAGTSDGGGWMYMNLNNGGTGATGAYSSARTTSQNWVIVRLTAEGRYSADTQAPWLGNGCSPNPGITTGPNPIRPAPNVTPP